MGDSVRGFAKVQADTSTAFPSPTTQVTCSWLLATVSEKRLNLCFYIKNQAIIMQIYLAGSKRLKYSALTYIY